MFGARRLANEVAGVEAGERALVIIDSATDESIAAALEAALQEVGAEVTVLGTERAKTDSGEPPPEVARAMVTADVVFLAVQVSLTHTEAVKAVCASGGRVAALTQWVPEMLVGGGIEADFRAIEPTVLRMAAIWDEGSSVRVTSEAGTDITLNIEGRFGTPMPRPAWSGRGRSTRYPTSSRPYHPSRATASSSVTRASPTLASGC